MHGRGHFLWCCVNHNVTPRRRRQDCPRQRRPVVVRATDIHEIRTNSIEVHVILKRTTRTEPADYPRRLSLETRDDRPLEPHSSAARLLRPAQRTCSSTLWTSKGHAPDKTKKKRCNTDVVRILFTIAGGYSKRLHRTRWHSECIRRSLERRAVSDTHGCTRHHRLH